jgi:hypothetical protein
MHAQERLTAAAAAELIVHAHQLLAHARRVLGRADKAALRQQLGDGRLGARLRRRARVAALQLHRRLAGTEVRLHLRRHATPLLLRRLLRVTRPRSHRRGHHGRRATVDRLRRLRGRHRRDLDAAATPAFLGSQPEQQPHSARTATAAAAAAGAGRR